MTAQGEKEEEEVYTEASISKETVRLNREILSLSNPEVLAKKAHFKSSTAHCYLFVVIIPHIGFIFISL